MRAVIFANGSLESQESARQVIQPGDLLVAADGGGNHLLALGLVPDLLVGDLDSIHPDIASRFASQGTEVIQYPARKDFTDLELALLHAQERGADDIFILAALGQRWDQTLANLLLPAVKSLEKARICLVDGHQEIRLLRSGETLALSGQPGDTVSLVPLTGEAFGITTTGLDYPLASEDLLFGSTRGISNVLVDQPASISLREGMLLVILIHENVNE